MSGAAAAAVVIGTAIAQGVAAKYAADKERGREEKKQKKRDAFSARQAMFEPYYPGPSQKPQERDRKTTSPLGAGIAGVATGTEQGFNYNAYAERQDRRNKYDAQQKRIDDARILQNNQPGVGPNVDNTYGMTSPVQQRRQMMQPDPRQRRDRFYQEDMYNA